MTEASQQDIPRKARRSCTELSTLDTAHKPAHSLERVISRLKINDPFRTAKVKCHWCLLWGSLGRQGAHTDLSTLDTSHKPTHTLERVKLTVQGRKHYLLSLNMGPVITMFVNRKFNNSLKIPASVQSLPDSSG